MLGGDNASELFDWLRTLSFMEIGRYGLFPHDLARDVLDADLRWRDPDSYAVLHRSVRGYLVAQINTAGSVAEKQRRVGDAIFVSQFHPALSDEHAVRPRSRRQDLRRLRRVLAARSRRCRRQAFERRLQVRRVAQSSHAEVAQLRLWVFALVIGSGKRLFAEGTIPAGLKLVDSMVSTTGVVIGTYQPAGEIVT